jgi:PAS domain S-box-containing protein
MSGYASDKKNCSPGDSSVLIVEDDPGIADLMMENLVDQGFRVHHVLKGADALEWIKVQNVSVLILDYSLSDMNAFDLLEKLQDLNEDKPPFIVTTGAGDERIAVSMMKKGARDYIVKDSLFFDILPSVVSRVINDVETEKKLALMQDAVRERDELLRIIFEAATGIAFIISDISGETEKIIEFSPGAESIFGYSREEIVGRALSDLYKVASDTLYSGCYEQGTAKFPRNTNETCVETAMIRKDGSNFPCLLRIYPVYDGLGRIHARVDVIIDISERKKHESDRMKLESRIQHAQKFESLGLLAGGIAHDFNNLLMAIIGHAGLAITKINSDSPVMKNLVEIEKASMRAGELCNQMLAYAGKGKMVMHRIDLGASVSDMTMILEASVSKKIRLVFCSKSSGLFIEGDSSHIKQVLMNLVVNSAEAIGEASGIINIEVGSRFLGESDLDELWLGDSVNPGEYVYLKVADNGCGMDEESKARVFDPFFSTKFAGRGLGLAALFGIIKAHKGAIEIKSRVNEGTEFTVYFPSEETQKHENHEKVYGGIYSDNGVCHSEKGFILLVDDEENVRIVGKEMLEASGFRVLTAFDGISAVDVFRENADSLQCVILDLAIRNDVPVLLSSGYSQAEISSRFSGCGYAGFIQKPYKISELAFKITETVSKRIK